MKFQKTFRALGLIRIRRLRRSPVLIILYHGRVHHSTIPYCRYLHMDTCIWIRFTLKSWQIPFFLFLLFFLLRRWFLSVLLYLLRHILFFLSSVQLLVSIWSYYELYGLHWFDYINMLQVTCPNLSYRLNKIYILCVCIFFLPHLINITFTITRHGLSIVRSLE